MLRTLILTAIFEPVLYMLFETLGISMSTNVTTAIILALSPISTCVLESVFLRERCSGAEKIFLGIGIVGIVGVVRAVGSVILRIGGRFVGCCGGGVGRLVRFLFTSGHHHGHDQQKTKQKCDP